MNNVWLCLIIMKYSRKYIRKLVDKALTFEKFNDLVYDIFYDVYKEFVQGQEKSQRIRLLVEHVFTHQSIDDFLNEIKEINPKAFNEFETSRQEQTNLLDSRNKEEKAINDLGEYLQSCAKQKS